MMSDLPWRHKIKPQHLARKAVVYLRQSTEKQVRENVASQRLQYGLEHRARELGWSEVEILDQDLGSSASVGASPRHDFDALVGSVALREVGIIMSREVSRLSRTDKDWCHLLEVCRVFDTLLGDAEQVYDLSQMDDQLVLGIKGTMSVVELNVLRQRLQQGAEEKARRGELVRLLPPGYRHDGSGQVVKDPDQRVQQAIALVFAKFRQTWSIRQTFIWFDDEGIRLPVNKSVGGRMRIVWQPPTHAFIDDVLHNPFYAGAYVYGRRPVETVLKEGRLVKRQGKYQRPQDSRVFIRDHHEGYIAWQTYEENLRKMRSNALGSEADEGVASVRSGQGLLASVLRCGRCGRRLHVRYWGKSGTAARYLCKGEYDGGGRYCLGFGGRGVDRRFGEELLRVLSPLGMRASVQAIERRRSEQDEQRAARSLQLQQLEYEAQRAFEQYDEVDPRNRLVASELERRWNDKLAESQEMRATLAEDGPLPELTDEERDTLLALGERFEQVWCSERCPMELKKKIVRTVVEEAIVNLDEATNMLHFVIHWKGGTHTQFEMEKPRSGVGQKTADEDLHIIRKMAVRYGDDVIAYVLTKLGRRTGKGKRWSQQRVATARRNHSIAGQKRSTPDPEILSMGQAAKHCGVSTATIKRLVSSGLLPRQQVVPWAPWEIRRSDLNSEPVRSVLQRLHETGRLVLERVGSESQIKLFS
jgi:DNA invertase Pin-like site-specific DNA recombinase